MLFVAGHGRSRAGSGWFFLPADFDQHRLEDKGIGKPKWLAWLRSINANKTWLILDACESGADERSRGSDGERQAVIGQLQHASGYPILSAAPEGKAAFEGGSLGHGVLALCLAGGHEQAGRLRRRTRLRVRHCRTREPSGAGD